MFNLGLSEIILIAIIALIFIGPKQLPEIARTIGRALNELKRASEDLTSSITTPKNFDPMENAKRSISSLEESSKAPQEIASTLQTGLSEDKEKGSEQ